MFDEPSNIPSRLDKAPKLMFNWDVLPLDQLLKYHAEIEKRLPATALKDINLEKELLLQFHTVRQLQTMTLDDEETAANQKATVANTVAATLNKLVEMQNAIYTSERFKQIEQATIRALSKLPNELAAQWLAEYKVILDKIE
jgi:hypothetical protein